MDGRPEVAQADRVDDLKPPANDEEKRAQFTVYGEPGKEPGIVEHLLPLSQAHALEDQTGTIAAVTASIYGDDPTRVMIQVHGYDADLAFEQWHRSVEQLAGFAIVTRPPAEDTPTVVLTTETGSVTLIRRVQDPELRQ